MDGTGGNKKMQKGHARRPRDKKHRKRSKNVKGQEETSGRDERKETIMVPIDNFMDKRQQSLEDSLVFHAEGLIAETGKTGTGTSVTHYNKEMTGQALHKPTPSSDIQYELHNDSPTSDIEDESHDQFTASDIRDRSLDNTMREEFDTSSGEEDIHDNTSKEAVSNEEEEAGRREKERDVLGHQRLREVASEESEDWDTASEENAVFEEVTETVSKNVEMTETDSLQLFKETKSGHLKGTNDNKYCGSEETDADRDYEDTEITYGEDKSITETDCVGKGARYGLNSQEEVREEAVSREAVSREADSREAVSGEADSREAVSGEADSRETVREEADSREAVREEADSREAVREEADSREAVREEADSREAVREEADSREAVREEADSREAVREEADSREAVREEADSREAVREEADSREAVREEADSREAVREEADSREAVREEADSREAVREEADSREAVREEVDSREAVREEADSREAVRKDGDTIVSDSKKTSRKGFRPESKVTFGEKIEADNMTVLEEMEASCSNPLRGEAEVDAKETDRWEAWSTEVVWKESRSDNNLEFGEKMETDRKMQILDTQTEKEETIRNEAVDKKTVGQENPNEQSVREQTQNEEAGDKGTVRREVKAEAKEMVRVEVKETSIEEADAKEMVMEEAIGEKLEAEAKETVRNEMVAIGWDEDVIDAKERVWGEVETETKEIVSEDAGAKETVRKKAEADAKEMVRGEVEAKETADMERETKEMATEEEEAKEMVRDEVEAKQTGDVEGETKEMVSEVEEAKEMVKEEAETDVKETDGEKADSGETNFNVVVNKVEKTALQHEISIVGHKETPREDSRVWTNEVSSGYEINQSDNNMDGGGPVNLNLDIPSNDRNKIGSNNDINARDITSYRGIAKTEIETGEKIFERAKLCEEEETATQYSKNDCQSGDITRDKEEDSALIDQLVKQSISQKEKDEGERGFTLQNLAAEIDGEEELLVLDNQVGHAIRSNLETTSLQEGRPDQDIASGRMVDIASDLAGGEIEPVNATEMVTASKREDQNAVPQGEEAESLCEREDMITVCRIDSEIDKMDIYGKETLSNVKDVWMEGSGLLSEGEKEAINSLRQNVDETDFQKQQSANMWVQEENGKDRGQSLNNVLSSSTIIYGDVVLDLADEHSKNNSQGLDLPCLLKDISLSRYEGDARDPHAVMQRDTEYAGTDLSETSETKIQNPQQHPSKFVQETDKYQTALQEGERMSSQVRSECFLEVTEDNIQLETVTRLPKKDDLSDDQVLDEGNTLPNEERQQSNAVLDDSQELKSSHFPVDDYSEDSIQKQKIPSLKAPSVTVQQPPSILSADLQLLLTDTKIGGPTGSSAFQTVLEDDHGKTSKEPDVHSSAGKTQSEGQFTFFPTQIFNPILLLSQSPEESGFYCEGRISESSTKEESHCLRSEDGLTTGHDIDKSGSLLHSNENNTIKQPSGPPASPLWLPPRPSRYAGDTGAYSKARDSPAYRPLDNPLIRRATIRHKKGSYAVSGQASKRYGSTFPSATQDNLKGTRIISPVLRAGTKAPTSGSPQSGTLTRQDKIYEETESTIGQTGNKPFLDKLPEEDLIGKEMGPKSSESIVLRVKRPGGLSSESEAARSIHRRHSKLINSSSLLYQEYSDVALNQEIQRQDSPLEERDPGSPRLRRRALSSQDSYLQRLSISSADSLWQDIPVIRGSSALLSMTREEQKLQEAKFELIMSEVLYLRSLNIAVDHFQHSTGLQEVLSTQDRQWLFSRLSEVRDASSDFLFDLEEEFENNMYNFQVCNVVISHEPNFRRVYLPYVTNQTYQERTYQKLMTDNPRFQQVLAKLESDPVCQRLSLKSFLILPFQRITRLRLLLQNILKRSAPGSNEELQATNAHNALEKLIRDCNESVQRMKDTEDLILLNQKIQFECKIFPLISQSRRLVKHGEVTSLEFSSLSFKWKVTTRPVYLHLFNDCLLLSRLREGGRFVVFDYAHASCVRVERCEMKLHGNQKNIFRVFLRDSAGAREASAMGREIAQEGKESEYMFRTETQSQKLRWIMALSPPKEETDFLKCHGLSQNQCLKSYKSRENDELSLDKADIIMVTQRSEDGWLHGVRLSDMQSGWFPQSHVQPISRTACLRNLEEEQRLQTARAKLQPPSSK